jgi:hypothetical protein
MRLHRWFLPVSFIGLTAICGCSPFDRLQGEFNAGSIDPFDFAPPYRTTFGVAANQIASFGPAGCARQIEGSCTIQEFTAYVAGTQVGYFRFPFSPSQITTTTYAPVATNVPNGTPYGTGGNPLDVTNFLPLRIPGVTGFAIPTPNVYIFDPPFPSNGNCQPPPGYSFDAFRDAVHFDQQGHIFTLLPSASYGIGANPSWTYTPVVAEVPVTSNGERCQDIKSEYTVLNRNGKDVTVPKGQDRPDGSPTGQPDGRYLALALIDPGAPVFKVGEGGAVNQYGITHQRWGWFNQFLVAYLEGGYISLTGTPPRMATQRIFYPRVIPTTPPTAGTLGGGLDVMEFSRGQPGYSPICQVVSYVSPTNPPPRDATTIINAPGVLLQPPPAPTAAGGPITPTFIFCLQVP